jgi:hypothetical protein
MINPLVQTHSIVSDMTKRFELQQLAMNLSLLAQSPPSTIVNISQSAIDRLAQDVGAL